MSRSRKEANYEHRLDVLHVTQPTTEGVGKIVLQLVADQFRSNLKVGVACPNDVGFRRLVSEAGGASYRWDSLRSPIRGTLREIRCLKRILESTRPRVVHLHSSKAGMIGRLAIRKRLPTVFQPNGWSFAVGPKWMKLLAYSFEKAAARYLTDAVICVSQKERDALNAYACSGTLSVIPNGLDLNAWDELAASSKADARNKLKLPLDAKLVVACSRVAKQKGPDLMVEIWRKTTNFSTNKYLIWAGEGDMRELLMEKTAMEPTIKFVGPTITPRLYFDAADLAVMPSRWEGHSLSLLEALAAGCPVVAFDVEGMRETITPDLGTVVPEGDLDGFANAVMDWLARSPSELTHVGAMARNRISTNFSLHNQCKAIRDVYASISQQAQVIQSA